MIILRSKGEKNEHLTPPLHTHMNVEQLNQKGKESLTVILFKCGSTQEKLQSAIPVSLKKMATTKASSESKKSERLPSILEIFIIF